MLFLIGRLKDLKTALTQFRKQSPEKAQKKSRKSLENFKKYQNTD
jgi:hypothetical protein